MKNNLKDKKVLFTIILAVVLILLHSWQYIKSDYQIEPLINLIMVCLYVPLALIFGFSVLPVYLLVYSFVWVPFESFDNYTSLFLLCSAISLNKRLRVCIIPYCVETIIFYMTSGRAISHICITACYILFFWNIYIFIQNKHAEIEPLILKAEEEKIIKDLANGKQQKQIDYYSHVTTCRKLKEARERNNCVSNGELVARYKTTNQLN